MTVIRVPDMMCNNCVKRISNILNEDGLKFKVSLDDKSVEIDGSEDDVRMAVNDIEDLGFTPEIVA